MALETERSPTVATGLEAVLAGARRHLGNFVSRTRYLLRRGLRASDGALSWWRHFLVVRFIAGSLLRRILVASLAGLVVMIGGILYFSENNAWLLDAKRESLRVQGEIIAAAIAGNARVETGRLVIHTDPTAEEEVASPYDDAFSAHELSLRPERVAPILRRLIQPTTRRARVYSRDGTLVMDSATLLQRGQLSRHEPKVPDGGRTSPKNFWSRLKSWMMMSEDLPVYREIGNANGTSYPEVRQALQGKTTAMLLLNEKGQQIVSTAVPIQRASTVQGVLLMSTRPGEIDQIVSDQQNQIWLLAAFAMLATLLSALVLARTVAGPIRRLSASADLVSRNIGARHELPDFAHRTDEVGQMASAFAAMTAALYRRVEASESFAADVAHELKNPLTAARSMAESLGYAKSEEQRREVVKQIQNELMRLNRLITDVSNASRLDAELARQQMGPVDVTGVVASVTQIFRDILSSDSRRVETIVAVAPFEGAFLVNGHAGRLSQVLTNLVDNAISFSSEGHAVTIYVRRIGPTVEFAVEDEGPGIPEDRLDMIFDRFYTDRPDTEAVRGKNSGLGLSISREIVRAHGGEILAENKRASPASAPERRRGARFIVRLPALVASARAGMAGARRAAAAPDGYHEPVRDRA
ncbi:stimulus-sensing domain-containing protein [Hyphomicrobium sp.]|uniref:stimulus-sensing domain-containing protein n=1 Tax=Hyphomicrobium sp. TaxID=82 RepID=UPI0025BDFA52|nr:stimulus-sensing domain-containing protein [Hyphomicrobium sp.]MCC7253346.1 stimulus-sensing domain-containing protein [Hyphomicrobium sp.]